MRLIFKSKVDWFYKIVLIIIPIIISVGAYFMMLDPTVGQNELFFFIGVFLLIYTLLLLLFFKTDYRIENNKLFCRSGFFKKSFEVSSIRKIEKGVSLYVGWKLGLAFRGLVIYYNKFDELYITPENESEFIETLKNLNPEIQVVIRK